jgi:hypothetical protein
MIRRPLASDRIPYGTASNSPVMHFSMDYVR